MNNCNTTAGLFETVIEGGYCIGCGACAAIEGSPIKIKLDKYSKLQAVTEIKLSDSIEDKLNTICPFSNGSLNEDQVGNELYGAVAKYNSELGYYRKAYAGYVLENHFREKGSSGGMGSWILSELLRKELVDGIIHVKERTPTPEDKRLFHYQLSVTEDQIAEGAKSKYYPIELSDMIKIIKERPGKYAVVGIPCFIKAVRLLARQDKKLNDRIKYCIGLICGHLKSGAFAEMFAWELGIKPNNIKSIDFRTKLENYGANQYGVTVKGEIDGKNVSLTSLPVNELYGTNWGLGFFKYNACDYCDDVVAETADITIGDAWLPQYVKESLGTNIVIVRHTHIEKIIEDARLEGRLSLEIVDEKEVVKSQKSGFNHRRLGLSYRLLLADKDKKWRPIKRIEAGNVLDLKIKQRQDLRMLISSKSHLAFKESVERNDLNYFKDSMSDLIIKYNFLYRIPSQVKYFRKLKNAIKIVLKKLA